MGGEPDYLHKKEAVTISPLHAASLTAASPLPDRLAYRPAAIPDMEGRSNKKDKILTEWYPVISRLVISGSSGQ